jgi:hypothetical protein
MHELSLLLINTLYSIIILSLFEYCFPTSKKNPIIFLLFATLLLNHFVESQILLFRMQYFDEFFFGIIDHKIMKLALQIMVDILHQTFLESLFL